MTPSTQTTPPNDLPLRTLTEAGKPPHARLSSARDAQTLYWRMHEAARHRRHRAALFQRMFDGCAPYDQAKLQKRGEGWRANASTLEGGARKDAAKVPYYELFSSADVYAHVTTRVGSGTDAVDASTASRIRSEAFDRMLRSWTSFDNQFNVMLNDFIQFNAGYLWWPKPDSWHFKVVPWARILFPDGCSTDPEEWEVFAIAHEWPVHKLWEYVKDAEAADAAGWNRKATLAAIRAAVPREILNGDDPLALQAAFKAKELAISASSATVQAASLYVREFDGKWSRMMVVTDSADKEQQTRARGVDQSPLEAAQAETRRARAASGDPDPDDKNWLFFKQRVADNVHQLLCPFIFEMGTGSINALDGLGVKLFAAMQAKDRIFCDVINNVMLRSLVVLQPTTGVGVQKAGSVQLGGGLALLPPNMNVQTGQIFGDLDGALAVMVDLDNRLDTNTGTYRPRIEKPPGNPESATAASNRVSMGQVLSNSAVNRFMRQLDRLYAEVHRRAVARLPSTSTEPGIASAIAFQRECREAGLSDPQMRDHDPSLITAVRTIGNGSPVMRQQMSAALLPIYPLLGPRGRSALIKSYVAAHAGQQGVRDFAPPEDDANVPSRDTWDASQEEADLHQGANVVFAPWQDSVVHALSHMQAGVRAVQAVQQGADPTQNAIFLQVLLPHVEQHIAAVGHPALQQQLGQQFTQLSAAVKPVMEAAKEAVEQQQKASQMSFEQQLAMQELQADIALKDRKNAAQLAQRQERHALDMQQKQQSVALSDATTAAGIQQQTAATVAEIDLKRKKVEAEIEAQRAKAAAQPAGGGE